MLPVTSIMTEFNHNVEEIALTMDRKSAGGDALQHSDQPQSLKHCSEHAIPSTPTILTGKVGEWNEKIESLSGLEARGIARVLPEDKHEGGARRYLHMWLLWFSINLVASNIITGLLGPLLFSLGWIDSVCIVVFATALASAGPSYMATFGPESGNRAMIIGRFFFGYWPSKLICVLNIIQQIGWGIIGCIIAGQMLSAVNGQGLTIAVGCVISALCIGIVAAFGIRWVYSFERYDEQLPLSTNAHVYDLRYAFLPQLLAIMVLIGSAGKEFDVHAVSVGTSGTVIANRCTYFVLIIGSIIGFAAISADLYVYYPTNTPKWITFTTTWSGMWTALMFCNLVGIGIATGVANNQAWADAYSISSGALLLQCYDGLGAFGGICVVILALGSITNNAPCSYSTALTIQALGKYTRAIPRWMWVMVVMVIELVCSVAGRNDLFNIFQNFLPIMSYWVCPWLAIVVEEHVLFVKFRGIKLDWSVWEDRRMLPVGFAAVTAFLCGWAGAVTGMQQVWWQGPLALRVGGYGGDIGTWLSIGFAGLVFPPLRCLELKTIGR